MKKLLELLVKNNLTIGSVESMTAGLFASTFANVPGASKALKGSLVTYASEEKIKLVGLEPQLIKQFGVVSKEVAGEMANKGREVLDVDVCVSITGNAGPTVEPGGMPVGRAYVGISLNKKNYVIELNLKGNRQKIRKRAVLAMQEELIKLLEK